MGSMRRIMLSVSYDGTALHGWQEAEGVRTAAGDIKEGVRQLTGEEAQVSGASRTDAGVHALMNLAVFDTASRIPPERFYKALNTRLQEDIRVRASMEVPPDFHPRFTETIKTYRYSVVNSEYLDPTRRLYAAFCGFPLDEERMARCAAELVGEHDFASFCAAGSQAQSTVRTVTSIEVLRSADRIDIRVSGRGFLYNMVRIIAGTLIEAGRGRLSAGDMREILKSKDRRRAGMTAPARGLTLEKINLISPGFLLTEGFI